MLQSSAGTLMGVRLDSLFTVTRVACKVSFRLRRRREMGKRFILGVISFIRKMVDHHFFFTYPPS